MKNSTILKYRKLWIKSRFKYLKFFARSKFNLKHSKDGIKRINNEQKARRNYCLANNGDIDYTGVIPDNFVYY